MDFETVGREKRKNEKAPALESRRYSFRLCRYGSRKRCRGVLRRGKLGRSSAAPLQRNFGGSDVSLWKRI